MYHDGGAEEVFELVLECAHEVGVALNRWSVFEDRERVTAQWDVLVVPTTPLVRVRQVWVFLHLLQNPLWQRYPVPQAQVNKKNILLF